MTSERACRACGRAIGLTPSGHLRAHACPHGVCCVPSYRARRGGDKGKTCPQCKLAERQLRLLLG
jgi:hypothetical protein